MLGHRFQPKDLARQTGDRSVLRPLMIGTRANQRYRYADRESAQLRISASCAFSPGSFSIRQPAGGMLRSEATESHVHLAAVIDPN